MGLSENIYFCILSLKFLSARGLRISKIVKICTFWRKFKNISTSLIIYSYSTGPYLFMCNHTYVSPNIKWFLNVWMQNHPYQAILTVMRYKKGTSLIEIPLPHNTNSKWIWMLPMSYKFSVPYTLLCHQKLSADSTQLQHEVPLTKIILDSHQRHSVTKYCHYLESNVFTLQSQPSAWPSRTDEQDYVRF